MSMPWVEPKQNIPENPTIQEPSYDASLYNPRKELFKAAMNRKWEKVLELYRNEKVQGEYINTRNNDTLLHVAISSATEKAVLDLLNILVEVNKEEMCKILSLKNKAGDTPLHRAAALGRDKVCRRMAKICPEMVTSARNELGETPLFSAVCHGKKDAFFLLEAAIHNKQDLKIDEKILSERDIKHCRRHDGNNILHYAIKGEQFDLAYEIIFLYPKLVNYVNSSGETALHTLANDPSVFKSGARYGLYDKIIYRCTITEPLKFQFVNFLEREKKKKEKEEPSDIQEDEKEPLPLTCKVCIDLFSLMKVSINGIFSTVASSSKNGILKVRADEENPDGAQKEDKYKPSNNQEQRRWFPLNYDVTISFFKIIFKLLLVVLGIGLRRLPTITKHKQKHRNAKTIMKKLVDHSTLWEYEDAKGRMEPADRAPLSSDIELGSRPAEYPFLSDIKSKSPPMIPSVEATNQGLDEKALKSSEDETVLSKLVKGIDMLNKVLEKGSLKIVEEKELMNRPDTARDTGSPVLVAAKMGITEMVKRILHKFPIAILDQDKDKKNIVLLAVEHRQVHVYKYMLGVPNRESVFRNVDKDNNSALHLAAKLNHSRLWSTGAALHIQWEIKWYKYVHHTMILDMFSTINKDGKTPEEVFIDSHDTLVKDGINGLTNTCQSCSVVAALFATVAFQSVSTVPGGVDPQSGFPILSKRPAFQLFAISSLIALCFSVTSVVMFLAILISNSKVWDFERRLPVKLILGLTTLFMAIASTLVAFCAGDFFVVENSLKFAAYPIYAIMCFPVTYFAVAQFPLYFNLIKLTIKKVPKPEGMLDY